MVVLLAANVSPRLNGVSEKQRFLTPLAAMLTPRCGVGAAELDGKLIAIGERCPSLA